MSTFTVTIDLPHPPPVLFRFLAEPRNRPLWQASLRTVVEVDEGEPHPGSHAHTLPIVHADAGRSDASTPTTPGGPSPGARVPRAVRRMRRCSPTTVIGSRGR